MDKAGIFHQEDENNMILSLDSEFDILGIDEHPYYKEEEVSALFGFHHHHETDDKPSADVQNHNSSSTELTDDASIDNTDHDGSLSSAIFTYAHPGMMPPSIASGVKQEEITEGAPSHLDILCGQSRSCASHSGNKRFQDVLEKYAPMYNAVDSKHDKMALTKEIVQCITNEGGRFLKFKDGEWQEISTVAARDKVSHALRTKVASWSRQQQGSVESSPVASSTKGSHQKKPSHRRRSSESRKLRRRSSQSSLSSSSSEIATVSFDGSDPSSRTLLVDDLLKVQREIFAQLQKEAETKPTEHPLTRSSRR
jgi:hypothetical protein